MYGGEIVESGPTDAGAARPAAPVHPGAAGGRVARRLEPPDARGDPGQPAGGRRGAARLPVRAALPRRGGRLHRRAGPADHAGRTRTRLRARMPAAPRTSRASEAAHDHRTVSLPRRPTSTVTYAPPRRSRLPGHRGRPGPTSTSTSCPGRSSASSARPGRARPRWPAPPSAWSARSAAASTSRAPTSARCRAASCGPSAAPDRCSSRSRTRCGPWTPTSPSASSSASRSPWPASPGPSASSGSRSPSASSAWTPTRSATAYPRQLSGGQRQRVSLARAIVTRPRLLFCDEPVSALDVSNRNLVLRLLDRLRHDLGLAVVIIAHDLSSLAGVADRVAVFYRGRLVEQGPIGEVLQRPVAPVHRAAHRLGPERAAGEPPAARSRSGPGRPTPRGTPTACVFASLLPVRPRRLHASSPRCGRSPASPPHRRLPRRRRVARHRSRRGRTCTHDRHRVHRDRRHPGGQRDHGPQPGRRHRRADRGGLAGRGRRQPALRRGARPGPRGLRFRPGADRPHLGHAGRVRRRRPDPEPRPNGSVCCWRTARGSSRRRWPRARTPPSTPSTRAGWRCT